MEHPLIGALLAFLGGAAVALVNHSVNRRALKKKPDALASLSVLRQALSVAYLVLVYLMSRVLPWDMIPLLVGAAVGLTVPAVLLSLRLARLNDGMGKRKTEDASGEGDEADG